METRQILRYASGWVIAGCFIAYLAFGKQAVSAETQAAVSACFTVLGLLVCLWLIFRAARLAWLAAAGKEQGRPWAGHLLLNLCGSLLILAFVWRTLRFDEMAEQLAQWIGLG